MESTPARRARVITVLNLKGGVGKTHSVWLLASVCQERSRRFLAVDLDTQANLTSSFLAVPDGRLGVEALFDPAAEAEVCALIRPTAHAHIDLVPAGAALARFDLSDQKRWEQADLHLALVDPVNQVRPRYDYVVFDCPPRLSLVSFAALCASDFVIIPMEAADWGAQGVVQVSAAVRYVRQRYNARLNLLGYLVSRFKRARVYQKNYLQQLHDHFGALAFDTFLPDLAQFEKSVTDRIPITRHAPGSDAAAIARRFFDEVERRVEGVVQAAQQAAQKTFSASPSLPLDADNAPAAAAHQGRRRLGGAFLIEVCRIRPDPGQPRKNLETQEQQQLTESVRRLGILQSISVRYLDAEDVYQIISGERRYQAARAAGLAEIPCWVQTPKGEDILLRQISENWQRADLHPYELADALAGLRDAFDYNQKQLAELTCKPESEISRLLSLLKLNPAVQQAARHDPSGAVTRRHLVALGQLPPEDQQEAMAAVRDQRLTAVDTERLVKEKKARAVGAKTRGAPVGQRFRYFTSQAIVTFAFRKSRVTAADLLAALDEIRAQVRSTEAAEPDPS